VAALPDALVSLDNKSARSLTFEALSKGNALCWYDATRPDVDASREIVGELDLPRFPIFPREISASGWRRA
jgi:hypothetical protein